LLPKNVATYGGRLVLYRLRPPAALEWDDLPGSFLEDAAKYGDLDRLPWEPTESRVFSMGLLRVALRHGVATTEGIVLNAIYASDLGHSDLIKTTQLATDEAHADLRAVHGDLLEKANPGWEEARKELDSDIRSAADHAAKEADQRFASILAVPVKSDLAEHWMKLGGVLPAD
jgi:hypothetical protein